MTASLRPAEWINTIFFSLFVALAWFRPSSRHGRMKATLVGAVGIGLTLAALYLRHAPYPAVASVVRDWLPAPLMLLAYWQAGAFVDAPNARLQNKLEDFDLRLLRVLPLTRLNKHPLLHGYFELAYLLCYPMIPLGLGVLYLRHFMDRVDQYWSVILLATYPCHLPLLFAHALPPRLLPAEQEVTSNRNPIRRLNLWILRRGSIRVITLPSAHVAMTMAASLVLLRLVPLVGLLFLVLSVSIAIGAVAGRYHYAADVLLGAVLAVSVYLLEVFYLF